MEEAWEKIEFEVAHKEGTRYEVSNLGRVRSFNKVSKGKILNTALTEGYKTISIKLYKHRRPDQQREFDQDQQIITKLYQQKKILRQRKAPSLKMEILSRQIEDLEKDLRKRLKVNLKDRTMNRTILVHREVAKCFLPPPAPKEEVVGHLDYNKLNNEVGNLKWMTAEESQVHQAKSPYVIAEKKERKYTHKMRKREKAWKLNSTQVMHIKMLLKRGRPIRRIAQQFDVSGTQIRRIRSGENWSHIKLSESVMKRLQSKSSKQDKY